ncbi:hypothetical protein [Lyngbya sp. CCY1209]|jgi:hypothetical protein|uniref:hypothetical protein n=1 Tax=Lyngbya sp. CCY1209 TaxID=2886103 RepID=UPI002D2161F6|nr:hypothetical protein [Lyngbya sp. CCY1209]MEB3883967.1 hypothetical protein [Lyngbya sp. CCY1209]
MKLQELQNEALRLSVGDRWQLVQTLLESLRRDTETLSKSRNLSRLRGIAKPSGGEVDVPEDYATYLTEKYQ